MREKRTIYLAYGSNLNILQMSRRCPDAKILGASVLADWRLTFCGGRGHAVATIVPQKGCFVPVGLWNITAADERALDAYEGFPHLYRKEDLRLMFDGKSVQAMVYIMNHSTVNLPSHVYFTTILKGYRDFGIQAEPLFQALWEARENRF